MIAALRAGIPEGLRGAPGMCGDHGDEQSNTLVGGRGRIDEGVHRERPRQYAQRTSLPANPERTGHGRAVQSPVLDRVPESLRIELVASESVSADQWVDKQEPGGLEDKFQVAVDGGGETHLRPRLLR